MEKIQQMHVSPPATNTEEFGRIVLLNFVREVDPQALYFSQTDVAKIASFPLHLEKQQLNVCQIINESATLLKIQLTEYKAFATTFLSKPLNYSTKEFFNYEINPANNSFEIKTALFQKWSRWLKFQVLMRMHYEASLAGKESLMNFEKRAREKVLARQMRAINLLLNPPGGIEKAVTVHFFKALAEAFDPHTDFFTNEEMKDFRSSLSSKALSWGFELGENKFGQAIVNKIVPGGPAWNSNAIHKDDIVLELNFENDTILETLDYSVEELNLSLQDPGKTKITVALQRLDGRSETIRLEKSEINSEENTVRSLVLKGEKKIGYISLPAFYTDWSDPSSKGCANEVAKELVKLKKENISGVILDLRFNGGGLVQEAVDIAGIFIDFGPLMIFQDKDKTPLVLKDLNRGVAYDGPLLVLINGLSASASEMVAAALQDHRRAIIAGTPSFGKSTGQAVFPLINKDTLGFVKITLDKIYRITGKTHQRAGVKPDILLPDFTDLFGYSERHYATALTEDSIVKKVYYTPLPAIPVRELRTKSETRVAASASFKQIKEEHDTFTSNIPLEINDFVTYMLEREEFKDDKKRNESKSFEVITNQFDNRMLQVDTYTKEINQQLLTEIAVSPYVEESFNILLDYIKTKLK